MLGIYNLGIFKKEMPDGGACVMQRIVFLASILPIGAPFEITKALDPSNITYWTSATESQNTPAEKSMTLQASHARSKSSISGGACAKSMVKEEQAAHGLLRNS